MSNAATSRKHLAELHALAAEKGVEGYRMMTRAELLEELGLEDEAAGGSGGGGRGEGRPARRGGRERSRRDDRRRRGDGGSDRSREDDDENDDPGEPVSGVLDITSRGHGFIRLEGLDADGDDVYVSPSQIRRCELHRGDVVGGPARQPRRGERHPALVHVDTVNGVEPGAARSAFEDLEAVPATRRLPLAGAGAEEAEALTLRAIDLVAPLARGHRVLVRADRGPVRRRLVRALASELAGVDEISVVTVLIDELPEEEKGWRDALGEDAELNFAGADLRPGDQLRIAELAVARAKRDAEGGKDVVLVFDSLSRLAAAADDPGAVKPIFAAGRETASDESGSLTVIATVLIGEGEEQDVGRVLATTENVTVTLEPDLAEAGVVPPLRIAQTKTINEDALREGELLAGSKALRAELAGLEDREAAEKLGERLREEPSNEKLLSALASS